MAYPTNSLAVVMESVDRRMIQLKLYADTKSVAMGNGSVTSTFIFDIYQSLKAHKSAFQTAAATAGLADYAKAQKNDANLNVATEFNAVIAAIDAVTTWISDNFPVDGSGYLLAQMLGADGPVDRTFSSGATSGLQTLLDALVATID